MNYLRSLAIVMALVLLTVTTLPAVVAQTSDGASAEGTASVKKVTKKKVKKVVKKKVKKVKKAKKMKKHDMDEGTTTPADGTGTSTPEVNNSDAVTAQYTVHIKDFQFQLPTLTIKKGETVEFIQDDEIGHTVSTDPHPDHTQLPGFVSEVLAKGQKFTHTFNDVGTWTYHCSPHPSMKGTIVVTE